MMFVALWANFILVFQHEWISLTHKRNGYQIWWKCFWTPSFWHSQVFSPPEGKKQWCSLKCYSKRLRIMAFARVFTIFEICFSSIWEDFPSLDGEKISWWCAGNGVQIQCSLCLQSFAPFPTSFLTDFLGKPAEKFLNGDHMNIEHLAISHKCVQVVEVSEMQSCSGEEHNILWWLEKLYRGCHDCNH